MSTERVLIMGAAGRDFHTFNTYFRDNPYYNVIAFTAAQIPGIANRLYPASLSGSRYPDGIPIYPEDQLESLLGSQNVDQVVFAYSDISHHSVMHLASRVLACGVDFRLIGPHQTSLPSCRPVISVCAVRTGCGKGMVVHRLAVLLREHGIRPVIVRHPMPYGDLAQQAVQRFASLEDCDHYACTIEEREEYEQHIRSGFVVYAGVDYDPLLRAAEQEADVIVWDGGNNDWPFFRSDLEIVLVDPHRPGHETSYHPGETNLRRAHVIIINKMDSAQPNGVEQVRNNIAAYNPHALVIQADSEVSVDYPERITGKRVLVIEDGPTLTHGEMRYGAGVIAAQRYGAAAIVDPRSGLQGSLAELPTHHPWITQALPALGYSPSQLQDLADTLTHISCDTVVLATPVDLSRRIPLPVPFCRVRYTLKELGSPNLSDVVEQFLHKQFPESR